MLAQCLSEEGLRLSDSLGEERMLLREAGVSERRCRNLFSTAQSFAVAHPTQQMATVQKITLFPKITVDIDALRYLLNKFCGES